MHDVKLSRKLRDKPLFCQTEKYTQLLLSVVIVTEMLLILLDLLIIRFT